VGCLDVGARIPLQVQGFEQGLLGAQEAHGEQHQLGLYHALGAGDLLGQHLPLCVAHPLDIDQMHGLEPTLGVALEFGGRGFFLAIVHAVDLGPFRPGVVRRAFVRGPRHDLDLHQAVAAVA